MEGRQIVGYALAAIVGFVVYTGIKNSPTSPVSLATSETTSKVRPFSDATYAQVDAAVGCHSKYSDQKKEDIFARDYKNHWMEWKGRVVLVDSGDVSLDLDGVGTQDLHVYFAEKSAGYNLTKGSPLKVTFLMTSAGGCFLPFGGEEAIIHQ
ncbi:hypothetical protein ABH909_005082 [Pseudomonas sp. BS3782 TE3695]|uniref:hypothetical protein n=1 Tax=unclassified Pseudomonas TaxID=196821 RepID=UPI0023E3F7B1|nr:hypothetical protein [Pseudomonas sp. D3]WET12161.1 hypothetical protein P3S72_08540 [Pseudomonas sp. D3]